MSSFIATIFHLLFKIPFFRKRYFGFYKRIFFPFNLFSGVTKKVVFRKNIHLQLNIEDWIQQNIYFTNSYEEAELNFVENNLKQGDTFIDIGANIGIYSLTAAYAVGETGKVFSFEPFETNFKAFAENIKLNNLKNIKPEQLAVAETEKTISLFYDASEKNLGMVSTFSQSNVNSNQIQAISLDAYLETKNVNTISMIKMDIEGAELFALRGMKNTLLKFKPKLLIEIDSEILKRTAYTENDIYSFLKNLNYNSFYLDVKGNLTTNKTNSNGSKNVVFV